MNYDEARALVRDGDMIAVKGTDWVSRMIRAVTKSQYSHTGIIVHLDDGVWVSQMSPSGNNLVPLSQFDVFDVFECPVPSNGVATYVKVKLRKVVGYSFLDCVVAGLNSLTRLKIPSTQTGLICSVACMQTYLENGWEEFHNRKYGFELNPVPVPTPGWMASKLKLRVSVD